MKTYRWIPGGTGWASCLALLGAWAALLPHAAQAGPGAIQSTDLLGLPKTVPTYYANSPQGTWTDALGTVHASGAPLAKFKDPLPGVGCSSAADYALVDNSMAGSVAAPAGVLPVATCIPVAVPDTTTYPGSDYYVLGVVEYAQQMHSGLPKATALRGYTQLNHPTYPATQATVADPLNPTTNITTYTAWPKPHYLGPIIVASRDRPVRVKYVNLLPVGRATFSTPPTCEVITQTTGGVVTVNSTGYVSPGADTGAGVPADGLPHSFCEAITNTPVAAARNGDLMIPNDLTIRGGGLGQNAAGTAACAAPTGSTTLASLYPGQCLHTLNRTELHLHGGMNPWISDGTPHQWVVPALETDPAVTQLGRHGESYVNVPDMADPGPGAGTLYWTNQQSARLMFYHDHTSGMTRTNVYVGEAAGYVLTDSVEQTLLLGGTLTPAASSGLGAVAVPAGTLPGIGIPLVIEDKTFVPQDIALQDSLWSTTQWGQPGDLWFPHVYEPNQDPNSITGSNNAGRWDYGQWFFPPMSAASLKGPVPQPSLTPEGFMDTPVINGTAYPTVTVPAGVQRFRILNVPNERTMNLSWFVADATQVAATGILNTEVKMVGALPAPALPATPVAGTVYACTANNLDATLFGGQPMPVLDLNGAPLNGNGLPVNGVTISVPTTLPGGAPLPAGYNHFLQANVANGAAPVGTPCWPASWPTDGRDGGVPDPTLAGPAWVQIGTEGGFLPQAQIIPPTPLGYEYNRRSVTVLNAYYHGLYIGPAERVDVLVDFTPYAGKTLILYNDSPAPNPGFDARNDYYTGDVDQTANGGAPATVAGYGPNTRTLMQVVVSGTAPGLSGAQLTALSSSILPTAFAASQAAPLVGEPGFSPAFPAAATAVATAVRATNPAYTSNAFIPQYGTIGETAISFFNGTGSTTKQTAAQASATTAQPAGDLLLGAEAIHEVFDTDYGRMNAVLGYELPLTNFLTQTTVPLAYVDPTSDLLKEGETQIWKITHNGVDTHTIHFHLVNLQVLNRVGWDGTIRPPDPNEVGWKESIKMNPLEDIYVAMQAVKPMMPGFNLPDSNRRLDPTQPVGSTANFTNPPGGEFPYIPTLTCAPGNVTTPGCLPLTGLQAPVAPATADTNVVANFGWEYVWHCHLLGHEENDMMRPLVMSVGSLVPAAPTPATGTYQPAVAATTTAPAIPQGVNLTWTDATPFTVLPTGPTAAALPAGTPFGNPINEVGFHIYRASLGYPSTPPVAPSTLASYALVANAIANSTKYEDAIGAPGYYAYAITAWNQAGESVPVYTGTVLVTGPAPVMTLAPTSLAFGNVQTGQSASLSVTVSNTGSLGSVLLLGSVTPPSANYTSSSNCPGAPAGLPVGSTCTLTLTFAPVGTFPAGGSAQNGSFSVASNASNSPLAVAVTGRAWPPMAAATPSPLAFGTVEQGFPHTLPLTVRNTGYGPWVFAAPTWTVDNGNAYSVGAGGTCVVGSAVAAGASCTVNVTFLPPASSPYTATLNVNETANLGATTTVEQAVTQPVNMTGTGAVPRVTITPGSLTFGFGNTQVGSVSAARVWTVQNTGTVAVSFGATDIALTGGIAGQFTLAGSTCAAGTTLAVGASCTLSAAYAPTVAGFDAATLTLNSGATQFASGSLSGIGVAASATLTPANYAFGNVGLGTTSAAATFTYRNTGIGSINAPVVSFTGANPASFAVASNGCPAVLAAGANCTVTVTFKPTVAGAAAATLSFAGSANGTTVPTLTAALTGNGVAAVPAINLGAAFNFGTITTAPTGANGTITLSNTGAAPLTISTITIAKTNGGTGTYTVTGGTCAVAGVVAAGGNCTVIVHFVDTATSRTNATLTVTGVQSGTTTPVYTATNAITGR